MLMKPDKSLVDNGVDGLQATTVQKSFLVHEFESLVSRSALRGVFHKVPCLLPRVDSQTTIQPGRLAGNVLTSQTTRVNDTKPKMWINTNFLNTSGFLILKVLFPCCPDKSNAIWISLSSIPIDVNLSSILRFSPRSPPSTPSPARIGQTTSTMPRFCLCKQKDWHKTKSFLETEPLCVQQVTEVFIHGKHSMAPPRTLVDFDRGHPTKLAHVNEAKMVHGAKSHSRETHACLWNHLANKGCYTSSWRSVRAANHQSTFLHECFSHLKPSLNLIFHAQNLT